MPNRLLKEGIVDSSALDAISAEEEVFFYRLLVVSDDFGRMDARLPILKSRCFPLKDALKVEKIDNWLRSLASQKLVMMYQVDSKPYLQILKWEQRVRSKGKYPDPDGGQPIDIVLTNDSELQTDVGLGKGLGKGMGKGNGCSRATRLSTDFELPSDWIDFCKTERPDLDPKKTFAEFKDHWIAQAGAKGVKSDWTATWRNWVRRTFAKNITTQDKPSAQWHQTLAGVMAKGKELGIEPRAGETEGQYRQRLMQGGA